MGQSRRRSGCGCGGTIIILLVITAAVIGAVWFISSRQTPVSGTLVDPQGAVETRAESNPAWTLAANGQSIGPAERLRTGGASSVSVAFFEVPSLSLGQNTEISVLEAYTSRRGRQAHLEIEHVAGQMTVRMVRFANRRSAFVVQTPNATTALPSSGAQIQITVIPAGITTVQVDVGDVTVTSNGPLTAAQPGRSFAKTSAGLLRPAMPAFQAGHSVGVLAGQIATIDVNGFITISTAGESLPDAVAQALGAPGTTFSMTVTEQEANAYVAANVTGLAELGVSNLTVWFSGGNIIFGGDVSPAATGLPVGGAFTLVAAPYPKEGGVGLNVVSGSVAGVPLPATLINQSIAFAEQTISDFLNDPAYLIQVSSIQVNEGSLTLTGTKPAP